MRRGKRRTLGVICLAALVLLCGCKQNPSQERLYSKLLAHFEECGYACELAPLSDAEQDVPIDSASAWTSLWLDNEHEILVYFDESNRADYLSGRIDQDQYGLVTRFGLRFVLIYQGDDENVVKALERIQND